LLAAGCGRRSVARPEKKLSSPLGHGSTAGIGSKVGSEAPGALTSFNPEAVPGFPDTRTAIVRVPWSPLRRDPTHRSEMVSQLLLGEVVELLGAPLSGWFLVRGPDGYEGVATAGSVREVSERDAAAWIAAADGFSLGTGLRGPAVPAVFAPWGARLARASHGGFLLPDGGRVEAVDAVRIVCGPERALSYPSDPSAAAETARGWMGAPYHWGGRIPQGTDCSGFVQSVFGLHGFRLPRDSRDQRDADAALPEDVDHAAEGRPGDLWFFAWDGRPVSHVGICLGGGEMLHASETRGGVAIDRLGDGAFGRRLAEGLVGGVRPER